MEKEKTEQYHLRLPKRLKAKLEKQAKDERRSLNQLIVVRLEEVIQAKTINKAERQPA